MSGLMAGKKAVGVVLLLISLQTCLTGCWGKREINEMSFISGIGIERTEEGQLELSVQIPLPKQSGGDQSGEADPGKNLVQSATGINMADAISKLQLKLSNQLFLAHTRVLILGERIVKQGFREEVDFFTSHPGTRLRTYVFATEGDPKHILGLATSNERSSAEILREMAVQHREVRGVTLKQIIVASSQGLGGIQIPQIVVTKAQSDKEGQSQGISVNGAVVIRGYKQSGELSANQVYPVPWIRNIEDSRMITVPIQETKGWISFYLLRVHTVMQPRFQGQERVIEVRIKAQTNVIQNGTVLNLMNTTVLERVEAELSKTIEQQVKQTMNAVLRSCKTDLFDFHDLLRRKQPAEWRKLQNQWQEVLPTLKVQVSADATIRRSGMSNAPIGIPKEGVKGE